MLFFLFTFISLWLEKMRERERDADFGSVSHAGIGTDVWTLPFENITRILKVGEYPYLIILQLWLTFRT